MVFQRNAASRGARGGGRDAVGCACASAHLCDGAVSDAAQTTAFGKSSVLQSEVHARCSRAALLRGR